MRMGGCLETAHSVPPTFPYPEVTAQGHHPGGGRESPVSAKALAVPTARNPASSPAYPLAPPNALKSPEPSWTCNSRTSTSCPKFRRPLPGPFKTPLHATSSGHPPWGAAAVALSSAWRRGQPSLIFSQHLSQFATSVYVSVASKHRFSRGDGFVFISAPDTQLKAWPHRVPAESLLQTEQTGRWVVGWKA